MTPFNAILLIVLFCGVHSVLANCPENNILHPCECEELDDDEDEIDLTISCMDPDTTLQDLRRVFKNIDSENELHIELHDLKLGTLPSDLFKGLIVKTLEISHCELDGLSEEGGKALSGLEESLEELVIFSSIFQEKSPIVLDLSHLLYLETLDLSHNVIKELSNQWFKNGPVSLSHLIVSNNGIETLGDTAFASLVNLDTLWLDGNRFGPVRRSMLPNPAASLLDIELDNNALKSIPEDMFEDMPSLKYVSVRTNEITEIPKETWGSIIHQVNLLDFRGNPIRCDDNVEWISESKVPLQLLGTCDTPRDKHGLDLQDLIES